MWWEVWVEHSRHGRHVPTFVKKDRGKGRTSWKRGEGEKIERRGVDARNTTDMIWFMSSGVYTRCSQPTCLRHTCTCRHLACTRPPVGGAQLHSSQPLLPQLSAFPPSFASQNAPPCGSAPWQPSSFLHTATLPDGLWVRSSILRQLPAGNCPGQMPVVLAGRFYSYFRGPVELFVT